MSVHAVNLKPLGKFLPSWLKYGRKWNKIENGINQDGKGGIDVEVLSLTSSSHQAK